MALISRHSKFRKRWRNHLLNVHGNTAFTKDHRYGPKFKSSSKDDGLYLKSIIGFGGGSTEIQRSKNKHTLTEGVSCNLRSKLRLCAPEQGLEH